VDLNRQMGNQTATIIMRSSCFNAFPFRPTELVKLRLAAGLRPSRPTEEAYSAPNSQVTQNHFLYQL